MAKITTLDEFEKEYAKGLGTPLVPRPWRTVSEEWLQRYAVGAGDFNPLFLDGRYAAGAANHALVAPPGFIFSIEFGANASIWGHIPQKDVSMKDLTILYLGNEMEWFRPIFVGDRIRPIETPRAITRVAMTQIPDAVICTGETEYWNSRGELVARLRNQMLRFPNQGEGVASAPADVERPAVAPDPLVWHRVRRGAEPLVWEDVAEGEEIPELPKGTYTTSELYMFSLMSLGGSRVEAVDEGTIDMGAGGRADAEYARKARAQAASFDFGPQRTTWLLQAVTDWAGDRARVLKAATTIRRPNLVGDTNTVSGRVVRVYATDDGEHVVDVEVVNKNHADVVTAKGTVTVALPVRAAAASVPDVLWTDEVRASEGGAYG